MMAHHSASTSQSVLPAKRKSRVVLAACGCVAAANFGIICRAFIGWAEVRAVLTKSSLRFVNGISIPDVVKIYTDDQECSYWQGNDDNVLCVGLSKWADMMVIAPLSANTLAKIVGGICDNLVTGIVRAWDYKKPLFVAPSMNYCMWQNKITEQQCVSIEDIGIIYIPPQRSTEGEFRTGSMADLGAIIKEIRDYYEKKKSLNNTAGCL